jgi:NADP-dependent 3-hydroxy acid dehydrogenase YdfG
MSSSRGIAIVTGASSGIGAATALALANEGFQVIGAARRVELLNALQAKNPAIEIFELDITNQESVDAFAASLAGRKVELLVNNAGGAFDADSVLDSDPDVWRKTYEVNVIGTVRMVKAITPLLLASGGGQIIVLGSTAGHTAYENGGSYVAAKFAERSLAATLRLELNGQPIRVSEISPGMVKTEEFAKVRFGGDAARAAKVYEGVAQPLVAEDIAEAIRWVATQPLHVNIDSMVVRPIAQAANHKVHRTL